MRQLTTPAPPAPPRLPALLEEGPPPLEDFGTTETCFGWRLTGALNPRLAERVADWRECEFRGVDFAGIELARGVSFVNALFQAGSLAALPALAGAWERVHFDGTRCTGTRWWESGLRDVTFEGCDLRMASFRFAHLERVAFLDCTMSESDFSGATLKDTRFERCDLRSSEFVNCSVHQSVLAGCELEEITGAAFLRGFAMSYADVIGAAPLLASALGIRVLDEIP